MQFRQSSACRRARVCAVLLACSLGSMVAPFGRAADPARTDEPTAAADGAGTITAPASDAAATDAQTATAAGGPAEAATAAPAAAADGASAAGDPGSLDPESIDAAGGSDDTVSLDASTEPGAMTAPDGGTSDAQPAGSQPEAPQTIDQALGAGTNDLDRVEVQIEAREFDAAIGWLDARIISVERQSHHYDPELIRPLTLLGDASMGKGLYVDALQHYQRATHLTRVNTGLKSLDQVPIVYREAAAYKALGDNAEANDREEYAYGILAAQVGPNDQALLPALYRLADWYVANGNGFAARGLYERAIDMHEANGEGETEAVVPALQGLASTYRMERFPVSYIPAQQSGTPTTTAQLQQTVVVNNFPKGEEALQRVVRIRRQAPEADPILLVEAILELGDWYTLFEKPERADALYAHGFELLGGIPDTDRVAYFAEPKVLYLPDPGDPRRRGAEIADESLSGFVEVAYNVTTTGHVRDLQTIAADPPDLMEVRVRRSLRVARYRPALVDGVPVASDTLTYRHEFTYHAEPEEDPEDQSARASDTTQPEVVKQ